MSEKYKITKLDHFCISAKDADALAEWYQKVLGFEIFSQGKTKAGSIMYFLKSADDETLIELLPAQDEGLKKFIGGPGHSHICFLVDDFEKAYKYLKLQSVHFREVRDTVQGWRIAYFDDVEGNLLELMYRPKPLEKGW